MENESKYFPVIQPNTDGAATHAEECKMIVDAEFCASGLPCFRDEGEEPGEALFEFLGAEGGHAFVADDAGADEAGIAKDLEVMGTGGLGDFHGKLVAGEFPVSGLNETTNDAHTDGVGKCLHDDRQGYRAHGWMCVRLHGRHPNIWHSMWFDNHRITG